LEAVDLFILEEQGIMRRTEERVPENAANVMQGVMRMPDPVVRVDAVEGESRSARTGQKSEE